MSHFGRPGGAAELDGVGSPGTLISPPKLGTPPGEDLPPMNVEPTPQELLSCAVAAASAAGRHAYDNLSRRGSTLLNARHDVKLELDVECQRVAETVIRSRFPDHALLGEEDPEDRPEDLASGRLQWVIDPIDGTINFFHGLPHWCCSVAVRRGGDSLAGAVYAPVMDELYTATAAGPALLDQTYASNFNDSGIYVGACFRWRSSRLCVAAD